MLLGIATGDDLGRAVMVGHVEGGEPGLHVPPHLPGGLVGVDAAPVPLHVGDLPQTRQHTGDLQAGRQLDPLHRTHRPSYSGGSSAKIASTSTPWRRRTVTSRR